MVKMWEVYALATGEVVAICDGYFKALNTAEIFRKKDQRTYCVSIHGAGN